MPNKNGGEPPAEDEALAEIQSTPRGAFRHVYGFVLQAGKGDKATADVIFEDYFAGKLSEELMSISRRCVSADQAIAGSSNRDIEEGWHRDKLRAGKGGWPNYCAFVSTSKLRIVRVNAHKANEIRMQSKYCRKSNGPTIVRKMGRGPATI